jgi:hypothetical protein
MEGDRQGWFNQGHMCNFVSELGQEGQSYSNYCYILCKCCSDLSSLIVECLLS